MANPRNGSSSVSKRRVTNANSHTLRSLRHERTSDIADDGSAEDHGQREVLGRQQAAAYANAAIAETMNGTRQDQPNAADPGQEHGPDEVAHLGAEVAGSEDPHQLVARQVDEGDLAGGQHGVGGDAQQQRPHGQHPPFLTQSPAGQAESVAEQHADGGPNRRLHPVRGNAGQPSHEPARPHQRQQERPPAP